MKLHDKSTFEDFWRWVAAPFALVVGLATVLTRLFESLDRRGLVILAASSFIVSALWTSYVITRTRTSGFDPNTTLPLYKRRTKVSSVALTLLCAIAFAIALIPPTPFRIYDPGFIVFNEAGNSDLVIEPTIEFVLTAPYTPLSDTVVATGKLQVVGATGALSTPLNVSAGSNVDFEGRFVAPELYKGFVGKGVDVQFTMRSNKKMLRSNKMPFASVYAEMIELK